MNGFKAAEASYLEQPNPTSCRRCKDEDRERNSAYCPGCNVRFAQEDEVKSLCDRWLCEVFVKGLKTGSSGVALAGGYRLIEKKIARELTEEIMAVFED